MSLADELTELLRETPEADRLMWMYRILDRLHKVLLDEVNQLQREMERGDRIDTCTSCRIHDVEATIRRLKYAAERAINEREERP